MIVLGINIGHDSSVCLIKDGIPLSMIEEERYVRIKHVNKFDTFYRFPANSIRYCLNQANITMKDVDAIAIPIDTGFYPYQSMKNLIKIHRTSGKKITPKVLMKMYLKERTFSEKPVRTFLQRCFMSRLNEKLPPVHFVSHHLAHAASSFYVSGFKESAILTIDGVGDGECVGLWKGTQDGIEKISSSKHPNSLGKFYEAFVGFIGLARGEGSYKMMGLAPYGKLNDEIWQKVEPLVKVNNGLPEIDGKIRYGDRTGSQNMIESEQLMELEASETTTTMVSMFGKPNNKPKEPEQYYKDIAFAAQLKLEETLIDMVNHAIDTTNSLNLSLAGGVALNCKANGKIMATYTGLNEDFDMFVQPAANDGGLSLGAALEIANTLGDKQRFKQTHCYYGSSYDNDQIEDVLKQSGLNYEYYPDNGIADVVADKLHQDYIIGWFQGRMEFGSRALGARSILANPTNYGNFTKVNQFVKHRELWRPLSPSCLSDYMYEYFEHGGWNNPFMIMADQVKAGKNREIKAVVHVDNSARPQSVLKETNPLYYEMIKQFESKSGVPIVMNTSFNDAGDPIVEKPEQAIATFSFTGLDGIAIGDYWVEKNA